MLNFRNTNIVAFILLLAFIALHFYYGIPWYAYLILAAAYLIILFYGSYFIGSQFYMKTFCSAITNEKQIAITFDDGPLPEFTPQILKILKEENVSATFFCIGKNIEANKDLLVKISEQGHLIGNHSFCHSFWFDLYSSAKMREDLQQTHDLVRQLIGKELNWFRPPYGVTNPNLRRSVKVMHYDAIGWNVRSMDTVVKDCNDLLQKMKKRLQPGAIILFHDTCKSTVDMLPSFLKFVKEQGYKVSPLDKLLALQAYRNI